MTTDSPISAVFDRARSHLAATPVREEDIHQLRVATKQLRAYLRLFPKNHRRTAIDALLRELAKTFAGQRDIDVQRRTLASLLPAAGRDESLLSELGLGRHTARADISGLCETATRQLDAIEQQWRTDLPALTEERVAEALPDQYRRCKRRGRQALKASDEVLHRWRKQEKYLLYQCELAAEHKRLAALPKQLKKLANQLGRHHDLVVLEGTLSRASCEHPLLEPLRRRLLKEKQRRRKKIRRQFTRSFTMRAKTLASRLQH